MNKPTVLFMHIPKTAGTAFKEAIECSYDASETLHLYPQDTFYPGDIPIWRFPLDHRARLRFVVGHFAFGIHEALPQDCDYITLVRRPFDRLVSQYFHLLRHSPELISVKNKVMSFREVLKNPPDVAWDNLMVRYFSGADANSFPIGTVDRAVFEMALKNLRRHFAYVGIQEDASSAYNVLTARYGWDSDRELLCSNVGGGILGEGEQKITRQTIERSEQWDMLLYEEVLRLFHYQPDTGSNAPAGDPVSAFIPAGSNF